MIFSALTLTSNIPREKISSMLGHSNMIITEHYLDGLDPYSTFGINAAIQ